jgi:hypothetical protein
MPALVAGHQRALPLAAAAMDQLLSVRARGRFGRRDVQDACRARRRRLDHQWLQDVHVQRAQRAVRVPGDHPARRRRRKRLCISARRSSERSSAVNGPPPMAARSRRRSAGTAAGSPMSGIPTPYIPRIAQAKCLIWKKNWGAGEGWSSRHPASFGGQLALVTKTVADLMIWAHLPPVSDCLRPACCRHSGRTVSTLMH